MNLYIDCEWNDFKGALISMALVAEDGAEWYESIGCSVPTEWVKEHVMPVIQKEPVSLSEFRDSLYRWLKQWPSVHIVADWPEDIQHFCNILIVGAGARLSTPPLTMEVLRIDTESSTPHNALADARALCEAVKELRGAA
jgi:hypothetical protein